MASPTVLVWELFCMGFYEGILTLGITTAMLFYFQRPLKPAAETGEQKEHAPSP